jgi:hypothetical protein
MSVPSAQAAPIPEYTITGLEFCMFDLRLSMPNYSPVEPKYVCQIQGEPIAG